MSITIKSNTTICYSNTLEVARQAIDTLSNMAETKCNITYRRMNLSTTNLVGDYNRTSYTDYNLNVIIMLLLIDDRIVAQGEMLPGDCEMFIKPYINCEADGTIIEEAFEPQIDDEIIFQDIRYRIKLLRAERIGNTKSVVDCLCSRLENDNPTIEWNENYRESVDNGRRGSGWN